MMSAEHFSPSLIDHLPAVRGRLSANEQMARYTWFKVGGPAEVLFRPADEEDLSAFLAALPQSVSLTVVGNASNLLIRDGGIPGVVIRLGSVFSKIAIKDRDIIAGAGAADLNVARKSRDAGLSGLEFLSGIPGTLGGAVMMNAGAYGAEIGDICVSIRVVDRQGICSEIPVEDLGLSYRHSDIDPSSIVTEVRLKGEAGDADTINERMSAIQNEREVTQPVRTPTGGSTFANPSGHKAWQLIDQAGCRGLRRGNAMVSDLHCNFLINTGGATANDLEGLGEEVRRRVFEHSEIHLDWEIRRIGIPESSGMKEVGQ
jgi:UDP-N-acetylmuramate dehydrogenase